MKIYLTNQLNLGDNANIVVRLWRNVLCVLKNFYTVPLLVHLAQKGIHSLGTVRKVRILNCKLPTKDIMKKEI